MIFIFSCLSPSSYSAADVAFDAVIGCIEDIIMGMIRDKSTQALGFSYILTFLNIYFLFKNERVLSVCFLLQKRSFSSFSIASWRNTTSSLMTQKKTNSATHPSSTNMCVFCVVLCDTPAFNDYDNWVIQRLMHIQHYTIQLYQRLYNFTNYQLR